MKQRPITPVEQRQMASEMHVWILDGLAHKTPWTLEDLAFQGGTSLALAWDSPRFSEDLDFVARNSLNFDASLKKIAKHVENGMQRNFPGATVELKEKKGDQQDVYTFAVSLPQVLGKVKVKTEFWKVENDFVKTYDRSYKMVARRGAVNPQVPVASMEQIYADKMVALGARERLKWRDVFDVWFLDNTGTSIMQNQDQFCSWIEKTLSLYNTTPTQLHEGWQKLLQTPNETIMSMAQTDLKPFLSTQLWEKLFPDEMSKMVENMKRVVEKATQYWPPAEYQHLTSDEFKASMLKKRSPASAPSSGPKTP